MSYKYMMIEVLKEMYRLFSDYSIVVWKDGKIEGATRFVHLVPNGAKIVRLLE